MLTKVTQGAFGIFPHGLATMHIPTLEQFPVFEGNSYIFSHRQEGTVPRGNKYALVTTAKDSKGDAAGRESVIKAAAPVLVGMHRKHVISESDITNILQHSWQIN